MMTSIYRQTLSNLKNDSGRWSWDLIDEEGNVQHYQTAGNGEGIYAVGSGGGKQIAGFSQFSTNGVTRATVRRRIAKFFDLEA